MGGDKLLRLVGFQTLPSFYWTIQDNSIPVGIFVFLVGPQLIAGMAKSGAFEIYLDESVVFSKLASGGMPKVDDLVEPLVAAGLAYKE